MRKFLTYVLAVIVTAASLFPAMGTVVSHAAGGPEAIDFTYQVLNPADNTTGVHGTVPGAMATTVMDAFMGNEVTVEDAHSGYDVRFLMATHAEISMGAVSSNVTKADMKIFVQDAIGSNSYTDTPYVIEELVNIAGQEFARYLINISSLDLVVSPRYTAATQTGFYIILDDTRPVVEAPPEEVPPAQPIAFEFQFLNPYDNTTGANGTIPNEPGAGINVMNQMLGSEITVEERDGVYYLNMLLATSVSGFPVENLRIFVEDAMGSNTYSQAAHTLEGTETINGQEFGRYQIEVNSLDLIISPRYTVMGTSGFFIILDERPAIEAVVNRAVLAAKLAEARAVTSAGITPASFASLQQAITTAQAVHDNANATQDAVNEQVTFLANAMNALVDVAPAPGNTNNTAVGDTAENNEKIYEVPVALWHATEDRASMVAESLHGTARLVVKDGVETMFIYVLEGPMGLIPGFQINNQAGEYVTAKEEARNAEGKATSFSFPLESRSRFVPVRVLTSAGTDQGQLARLRFDFAQMKEVASDTDLSTQAPTNPNAASGGGIDTLPGRNNLAAGVKTGDNASVSTLLTLISISLIIIGTEIYKRRFAKNERRV